MTYFTTSIFRVRPVVHNINGKKYYYLKMHLPLRKQHCEHISSLVTYKASSIALLIAAPEGVADSVARCVSDLGYDIEKGHAKVTLYSRTKRSGSKEHVIRECRVMLQVYVRKEIINRYGTDFLVYYDKITPLIVAFPAAPITIPCIRDLILQALEKPSTIVRSFTPEEIASILFGSQHNSNPTH